MTVRVNLRVTRKIPVYCYYYYFVAAAIAVISLSVLYHLHVPFTYSRHNDASVSAPSSVTHPLQIPKSSSKAPGFKLQPNHTIYSRDIQYGWDNSPIVLEEYKLLFFTIPKVGCTVFKMLFRRIMGFDNWQLHEGNGGGIPHARVKSGLKFLYDYPMERANDFLTSPDWTRAIFVRDARERVLSAYLDKVLHDNEKQGGYIKRNCCKGKVKEGIPIPIVCDQLRGKKTGFQRLNRTTCDFETCFLRDIVSVCNDPHWRSQVQRLDPPELWSYINFVGHFDTIKQDTRQLLQRIGAWEPYGASGWNSNGSSSSSSSSGGGGAIFSTNSMSHATSAKHQLDEYYFSNPNVQRLVNNLYRCDYEHKVLKLTWPAEWQ
jgi:hypothetical protein